MRESECVGKQWEKTLPKKTCLLKLFLLSLSLSINLSRAPLIFDFGVRAALVRDTPLRRELTHRCRTRSDHNLPYKDTTRQERARTQADQLERSAFPETRWRPRNKQRQGKTETTHRKRRWITQRKHAGTAEACRPPLPRRAYNSSRRHAHHQSIHCSSRSNEESICP